MNLIIIVTGIIIALVIGLLYERQKRRSAEALNANIETKEKIDEVQKDVTKNEALVNAEEEKRKAIKEEAEKKKNEEPTKDDLLDFFNKPKQ